MKFYDSFFIKKKIIYIILDKQSKFILKKNNNLRIYLGIHRRLQNSFVTNYVKIRDSLVVDYKFCYYL